MSTFNVKRLAKIGLTALGLHVLLSVILIAIPSLLDYKIFATYQRYLIPGAFFTESRIHTTTLLQVSWLKHGAWSAQGNPSLENYRAAYQSFNFSRYYRSSLERDIYEWALPALDSISQKEEIPTKVMALNRYFISRYVPVDADSIKFLFVKEITKDFQTKRDTVKIFTTR